MWKPVTLTGAIFNENVDGLVGIEECTDYDLSSRKAFKRKFREDAVEQPVKRSKKKSKKKLHDDFSPSKIGSTVTFEPCHSNVETVRNVSVEEWRQFDLPDEILKALGELGFAHPTHIQSLTLPPSILGRKDILGAAETGSGKTLAFGLPILRSIINLKKENTYSTEDHPLFALILTPTRELAMQVQNHLQAVAKYTDIKVAVIVGGMAAVKQERILSKSPEIVVATPGRLWELIQLGQEHLSRINGIRFLVIDETDRMLEKGHFQELQSLLEKINVDKEAKTQRQNFVFSATLTLTHDLPRYLKKKIKRTNKDFQMTPEQKLKKIITTLGITDPKVVDITKGVGLSETLKESRINCSSDQKDFYIYYFIQKHPGRTIIFCNSIGCVKRLTTLLSLLNCNPLPLHASMQQRQRLKNLERFREKENSLLIATDVAARGLDIPSVDHVLHYQTPRTSENYVHRSGRAARASRPGLTLLLIDHTELQNYLKVCKTLGKSEDIPLFPIQQNFLEAVKQRVNLARELDKLQLLVRKTNSEAGWFEKAAKEMDIVVDHMSMKYDVDEGAKYKKLADVKRKQLTNLLEKQIFPKGIIGKYSLSNNGTDSIEKIFKYEEKALDILDQHLENEKHNKKKVVRLYKPKKNSK